MGRRGSNLSVTLQIPEGTYDPVLGMSYQQISREGLGYQKSQNGGSAIPDAGQLMSGYHRFGSVVSAQEKEEGFFDGIDTSLMGIATLAGSGDAAFLKTGLAEVNAAVEEAIAKYASQQPEATAPALAKGFTAVTKLLDAVGKSNLSEEAKYDIGHELQIKRAQFNDALAEALGLSIAANVAPEWNRNRLSDLWTPTLSVAIPGRNS